MSFLLCRLSKLYLLQSGCTGAGCGSVHTVGDASTCYCPLGIDFELPIWFELNPLRGRRVQPRDASGGKGGAPPAKVTPEAAAEAATAQAALGRAFDVSPRGVFLACLQV